MSLTRLKHIVIDEDNYLALKRLGRAGDSFNDVVSELLKKRRPVQFGINGDNR